MSATILHKISTATVGLQSALLEKTALESKGVPVNVLIVGGFVTGMESGVSQFGNYIKFKGEFEGQNLLTGEVYRSGKLLLPPIAEGPISQEFEQAEGGRLKFAMQISVEENKSTKGGVKYKYGVKPLVEPKSDDELSKLMKSLPAPAPASATPKKK